MKIFDKISKVGVPLVIAISIILGMYIQLGIDKKKLNFQSVVSKGGHSKIESVLNYVEREYVDTVDLDKITEEVIGDVLKNLDPHSVYISAEDFASTNEPLQGNFDGIGVQFNIQKDTVSVVKTIVGGPSEKVGIKDGDRIVMVNDSLIAGVGINNSKVMKLLRGKKGSSVDVGIARRGESELVNFTIVRDKIPINSIDVSYMVENTIGYIRLSRFGRTTHKEFQQAISKLSSQGMKSLIFDLRGNGGGYMDAAINIADEFLDNGKLIVYTEGRARPQKKYFATNRSSCKDIKLVVLIDSWSASASEIVSGAIQDNDRGMIVGRRSFGKGLVQEPVMLNDGSSIRLTIARYYTPAGRCIQKPYDKGSEDYYEDIYERFLNGEVMEKDSIHLPDSLKYHTSSGRLVYGGGGIMPDVFVAVDTLGSSEYLGKIRRKGIEYSFCFEYTDKNRAKLTSFKTPSELRFYLDSQKILSQFVVYASSQGVKKDVKGLKVSGEIIETQILALISRNIFDNEGFYPVIQEIDKTLLEGIRLIKKETIK